MKIRELKEIIIDNACLGTDEIRISNMSEDYTRQHPDFTESGSMVFDSDTLMFVIDWNRRNRTTVEDFLRMVEKRGNPDEIEIESMDEDDYDIIEYTGVHISNNLVILLPGD